VQQLLKVINRSLAHRRDEGERERELILSLFIYSMDGYGVLLYLSTKKKVRGIVSEFGDIRQVFINQSCTDRRDSN
jgi:hypothetical protein